MKNLKLQVILLNSLATMLVVIFLTSCEYENIIVPNEELNISSTESVIDEQISEDMYNNNALVLEEPHTIISPVTQNEIEVIINDPSHSIGDTYTINFYYRGVLHSRITINSLRSKVDVPTALKGNLVVQIKKYVGNTNTDKKRYVIIAAEVREPG